MNYRQLTVGLATTLLLLPLATSGTIMPTDTDRVEVPVGNAPRLPYRLWVTDENGKGAFRQVKWQNSSLIREQAEADARLNPAGTEYLVRGYIIGDNTTPNGFPVVAKVRVTDKPWPTPATSPIAEPLPLDKVTIEGDHSAAGGAMTENRLTWNRDLDIGNLLTLDVRQQLYNYRDTYGLPTDGYPVADGWDSPTTKLKGHGSGHYMSAMAMAYACCSDVQAKAKLTENIHLIVNELRECQERTFVWNDSLGRYWEARDFAPEGELMTMQGTWKDFDRYKQQYRQYGYGYLNAIPAHHCVLVEKYSPYNNEKGVWAPYYSVHKQLAGLIDIATYVDDKAVADKALLIAKDMGLWVWNRLHFRTYVKTDGSTEERRARPGNRYEMWNMYIAGEVGGMEESLARLAGMVSDTADSRRLLEAATYFDSPAFFEPLARNIDAIRTRHANQHIPMVTGALRAFRVSGNLDYYHLARNFWTMIQGRYRYAMGGVGNGEMFRQPYSQMTSMCSNATNWGGRVRPEPTLNETCCAYNLAKLTKDLNCFTPDDAAYMDYYERVLYNQIIGSLNPAQYQVVYQYAVGLDASKPWGNETPQSSCCGGTGAENHVKYQEATYFVSAPQTEGGQSEPTLWVALYMPTTAQWDAQGVVISQECRWPAEQSVIRIAKGSGKFAMKLRVPYWATEGFDVKLNGKSVARHYQPSSYVVIPTRKWTKKDVVEVTMPFSLHIDFAPDKMQTAAGSDKEYEPLWAGAIMAGPLVMATTGITNWDEATLDLSTGLDGMTLNAPVRGNGANANLYTMNYRGMTFIPDYQADRNVTHYFRMNLPVDSAAMTTLAKTAGIDKSELRELLLIAQARRDEQQAWNQLNVKVPEYAPWAPHAFARMEETMLRGQQLIDAQERSQEAISQTTATLNAIINTMRPGNLPEPEDLMTLTELLTAAQQQTDANDTLRQAIGYANMVVKYVNDGSGTKDMIERAERQLKECSKTKN